jgi:hypothetical protein
METGVRARLLFLIGFLANCEYGRVGTPVLHKVCFV